MAWLGMLIFALTFLAVLGSFFTAHAVEPWQYLEHRYCGQPKRNAANEIIRSSAVRAEFQKQNPCPSTGLRFGSCPGYAVNHDRALACGGCDAIFNLSWMRNDAKKLHDSYERKIQGGHVEGTDCGVPPVPP
jgi:hypothetical protein